MLTNKKQIRKLISDYLSLSDIDLPKEITISDLSWAIFDYNEELERYNSILKNQATDELKTFVSSPDIDLYKISAKGIAGAIQLCKTYFANHPNKDDKNIDYSDPCEVVGLVNLIRIKTMLSKVVLKLNFGEFNGHDTVLSKTALIAIMFETAD